MTLYYQIKRLSQAWSIILNYFGSNPLFLLVRSAVLHIHVLRKLLSHIKGGGDIGVNICNMHKNSKDR
jgi:hypothetical protein